MANLSRIRDAAAAICERGPPGRNRRIFRWKIAEKFGVGAPAPKVGQQLSPVPERYGRAA